MSIAHAKAARICPGCGTLNPGNAAKPNTYWECPKCRWEEETAPATVGELLKTKWRRVLVGDATDLPRYLRTLFRELEKPEDAKP